VKADGLAAGKGVFMCDGLADAEAALDEIMSDRRFGEAGARVVVEERMEGEEASYYAITDGEHVVTLAAAQDHKRALDGDEGENTGGMGAYSPAPVFTDAIEKRVLEEVVHPAIRGMAAEGTPYRGVLYVGLMIDASGDPRVVEFNVRFGDPETQPLLVRMDGDLVPILDAAARGGIENVAPVGFRDPAVCVVLASGGYPRDYETGIEISGLDELEGDSELVVFHAGTRRNDRGVFETAGGRVLGITARGTSVAEARERAYAAADRVQFKGVHMRRDIASRALDR
jgi:phosphoribosylamine--glycine ligase